jgi:hypothetical protein
MRQASRSFKAGRDIQTRKHLMERSFARSQRFGFDQAQWRGLQRVQIQEYLTCAIQSVQALVRYGHSSKKSPLVILQQITVLSQRFRL